MHFAIASTAAVVLSGHAANIQVEIPVSGPSTPFRSAEQGSTIVQQVAAAKLPDQDIATDHPQIWCRIRRKEISVYVASNKAAFPVLPVSTSCRFGADQLQISVVELKPKADPAYDSDVLDERNYGQLRRGVGTMVARAYRVGSGVALRNGAAAAGTLTGTHCEANNDLNGTRVTLVVEPTANDGTTVCELPADNGNAARFTFEIRSAEM